VQGLDLIHYEHRELVRLTDAVIEAADDAEASLEQIALARQALGQLVIRHVANKQAIITATLLASADPAHHQLAWRFTEDLMKLRGSTSKHYGVWTVANIAADRTGFAAAVRYQRRLLRARIAWEEHAAFPIVAELLDTPAPRRVAGIR
jgi:3-methyladenine DNA glycosylase Mpg